MWEAIADYADGTSIRKTFRYNEGGNYSRECERQHEIECWLIEQHADCVYYSVNYIEEE